MADLAVVGGGPAGLATAIRARLAGLDATVIERFHPPIDKACGEGLMPDAVARLREIGVEPPGFPFRGIRYVDGDLAAEGTFPQAGGLGVRRVQLHEALVRRAEETGVELLWGVSAQGIEADGVITDRGKIQARWIAGADGLLSRVRRWAGLEGGPGPLHRFGVRRHYTLAPWTDLVEVHWGPFCEAYVTPVGADEIGVALLWSDGKSDFDDLLERLPALQERLAGAPVGSRDRGAGPLHQKVLAVHRGNVALVGDASGYLDAITGEGMAVALHHSAALVDALVAGDLSLYGRAHRRI
ncbi:MAG: NAD(P)/FAD-dependent oxidoreductase, partial [Thermoanaerobaculia bacterium]